MTIHQCAHFNINPRLVHERAIIYIEEYLASMYTYTDLPGGNRWLYTWSIVYRIDLKNVIKCYVDANFTGG